MSNSSYALNLVVAAQVFAIYSTYITFGVGLIGNLLNIAVFTKMKIFRGNRCIFYLIVESIVDIGQLCQTFVNEIWKFSINGIEPVTVSLVCNPSSFIENEFRKFCNEYISPSVFLPFMDKEDQFFRMCEIIIGQVTARQSQIAKNVAKFKIHDNPQNQEEQKPEGPTTTKNPK
ncbi:unnamed protein product [Rotaria sordida]|uniref:Uncharacterized protein n=1 Tax=Rotaria sordida TaxID=392033 RepID=A0A815QI09_9BILA|nr:unnamed protein product [Rotaria sordida]